MWWVDKHRILMRYVLFERRLGKSRRVGGDGLASSLQRQLMVGGTMHHLPRASPRGADRVPRLGRVAAHHVMQHQKHLFDTG